MPRRMPPRERFRKNLDFASRNKGQRGETCEAAGVSMMHLNNVIAGRTARGPSLDIACSLAEAVGYRLEDMLMDCRSFQRLHKRREKRAKATIRKGR